MRQCEACSGEFEGGAFSRFCDPCRARRRAKPKKYVPSEMIDRRLREFYLKPNTRSRQSLKQYAALIRWPVWALRVRARELGLARVKEKPWSAEELKILGRFAWMSPNSIRIKLKERGFERTATAIDIKLDRTAARQNTPYYTGRGLASCLGVDSHVITRWISLKYLAAERRGTERTERNGGDMWQIHENAVRQFVFDHPMEFDLRKVDQMWFLDMLTDGKIAAYAPHERAA